MVSGRLPKSHIVQRRMLHALDSEHQQAGTQIRKLEVQFSSCNKVMSSLFAGVIKTKGFLLKATLKKSFVLYSLGTLY